MWSSRPFSVDLGLGDTFSVIYTLPDSCTTFDQCQLTFSFSGEDISPTTSFTSIALAPGVAFPPGPIAPPEISPNSTTLSGPIVAFDDTVQIASYTVTLNPVPEPATLPVVAAGLLGAFAFRRRRAPRS